jgi:RNA polymerase sigma-70 factor (ECF subfamily)
MSAQDEFQRLLGEHRDALYRFARQMSWDRSRAEDALQDAALAAFRAFDRFQTGTNFKAWVFRFLINTLLNENRRYRRELQTAPAEAAEQQAEPAREPGPDSILDNSDAFLQQLTDPVKHAVESLSASERMVFLLRVVEDFSYKEIAELLEIPAGTAMSHLFRGREKLRRRLSDYARQHGFRVDGRPPSLDGPAGVGEDRSERDAARNRAASDIEARGGRTAADGQAGPP